MDVSGFADLWEHVRLLSDGPRNEALLALLRRRAPGARVLEVGCGSGLLSCVAARLGAQRVYAVEPTAQAELARALVEANGLQDRVIVLDGLVEDLDPEPVDLAFAELLNADPFVEGLVSAMGAAASWLAPGGHLAPSRLRVRLALIEADKSAVEVAAVRTVLRRMASEHGLELGPLREGLEALEPYRYVAPDVTTLGTAVDLLDLDLHDAVVPEELVISVPKPADTRAGGAVLWFEAVLDEGLVLSNHPGRTGHWGVLVQEWPRQVGEGKDALTVRVVLDEEDGATVEPAG